VYRERFKAERRERVVKLGSSLGLPKRFCEEFVDLYYRLTVMTHSIDKFMASEEDAKDTETKKYKNRARAITETFWEIATDVYDLPRTDSPKDAVVAAEKKLVELHEVASVDAIERLRKVLKLSEEWVESLGSRDANFSEFLAKTRTVVSGTLVGIGYKGTGVVQNIFDWVIIDEAGRAAPSELAVAMQAGQRILLVGDHKQLPPTFSQGIRELVKKSYGVDVDLPEFGSDFARIFDSKYGADVGSTLLTQYRMAPDIGELVSSCFYDDTLITGRGGSPEYYEFLPQQLQSQVTWVDTSPLGHRGLEQESGDKVHHWNTTEAHVVLGLLREILDNTDFMDFLEDDLRPNEPAIGVVCLYSKQREIIDRMLAEAVWLENRRRLIKVDTVDSYQGKENRIVILSTVRNNTARKPGFLRSPNRINVAMSRAMERLFIVGATRMWEERNKELPLGRVKRKVFEFADAGRARILSGEEFLIK